MRPLHIMIMIVVGCMLLYYACDIDYAVAEKTDDTIYVADEYLWRYPLTPDTLFRGSVDPVYCDNIVLFGGSKVGDGDGRIGAVTADSGKLIWVRDCEVKTTIYTSVSYQNYFLGHCDNYFEAVDIYTGNLMWSSDNLGAIQLSQCGATVFCQRPVGYYPTTESSLMMTDITTGLWDTVFHLTMVDDYSVDLLPPGSYINNAGDTIIVFQNRQWNFNWGDGMIDLYAYNLSADTVMWVHYDMDEVGNNGVQPPFIYDDKVFFRTSWILHCYDLYSGEEIWQHTFGLNLFEHLLFGFTMEARGYLIVKTSGDYCYAFDPDNGNEVWVNSDAGGSASNASYYKGMIYYSSDSDGKIYVMDAQTGEIVKKISSPSRYEPGKSNAAFFHMIAINPDLKYIYASDGYYLYCFKIAW